MKQGYNIVFPFMIFLVIVCNLRHSQHSSFKPLLTYVILKHLGNLGLTPSIAVISATPNILQLHTHSPPHTYIHTNTCALPLSLSLICKHSAPDC